LTATSINWGPWDRLGMTAALSEQYRQVITSKGIEWLQPETAIEALERFLVASIPQVGVISVDWEKYLDSYSSQESPGMLLEISRKSSEIFQKKQLDRDFSFVQTLKEAPMEQRWNFLFDHVSTEIKRVIGMDANKMIGADQPLRDFGMDSLMAVEFKNIMESSLKHPLPATLIFNYPTLESLTQFLADQVLGVEFSRQEVKAKRENMDTEKSMIEEVELLSDQEAEEALLEELKQIKTKG